MAAAGFDFGIAAVADVDFDTACFAAAVVGRGNYFYHCCNHLAFDSAAVAEVVVAAVVAGMVLAAVGIVAEAVVVGIVVAAAAAVVLAAARTAAVGFAGFEIAQAYRVETAETQEDAAHFHSGKELMGAVL